MKKLLLSCLMLLGMAGSLQAKTENVNLTFKCESYCNAAWDSESRIFSWGTYPQDAWMSKGWTFTAVTNLSGDVSDVQKLVFKLENWTNTVNKLTIYFKENTSNNQSMDYVAKAELVPDANGDVELDMTTFAWVNAGEGSVAAGSPIDKTNIADVTIYGGARTDEGENGSVKITEAYKVVNANPTISIDNPANLVEIPQTNAGGGDTKASAETEDGITTYTTTTGNICVIFKMENVDVSDCDYITMKFAEATPAGINYSFWAGQTNQSLPNGITELKYVFADDANSAISDNKIPQVTLLTIWAGTSKVLKVKGVYKHQISETTYTRTYSFDQALDFTDTGLEAYVISAYDKSSATLTLTKVTKVPANTGLYLVGKDGDYEIPTIASADAIATNFLHASSGTDELALTEGSNTNLIFGGTGDNRGFHPLLEAGVIGANKAYLQLPTADLPSNGARLNIVFEDGTTAIKTVNDVKVTDNAWYDLQGRRVAQPTKGLYIQNSKKVLVK